MAKNIQRQELRTQLTPQQILKANILQLNAIMLEQRIVRELETNPVLEESEISPDQEEDVQSEEEQDPEEETEFEWEEILSDSDDFDVSRAGTGTKRGEELPTLVAPYQKTLADKILDQLMDLNLSEDEMRIANEVVGNIDDDGYFEIDPLLISDRMRVPEQSVLDILKKIRGLDPPGIGSRNIQECLLSQLQVHYPGTLAHDIVEQCFDDLTKRRFKAIAKALDAKLGEIKEANEIIKKLNPKPGEGIVSLEKDFIIPDIAMEQRDGKWVIHLNDSEAPELRISKHYKKILFSKKESKDTLKFIKEKIEAANWFIEAINSRKETMLKVMNSIVEMQPEMFDPDKRTLRPMILKDVADAIDMDISTISRVTNGRYVQLPWQIHELKDFFSTGIDTTDGEQVSSEIVRTEIKKIIDAEDKSSPIDDKSITAMLNDVGYLIARRTVAKYREQLGFNSYKRRKEIADD